MNITITNNTSNEIEETIIVDLGAIELDYKPSKENKTNAKALTDFIVYFNTNVFTIIIDAPYWANINLISSVTSTVTDASVEINFNDLPAKIKKVFLEINTHSFAE
jgi:hypothetical protein